MALTDIAKAFTKKNLPDSAVELVGEIPYEEVSGYEERALKHLQEHVELPGFRPGHVPLEMVKKKVGDVALLEESVELFMQDFYAVLLEAHSLDAVGRPAISITKLAPGNPIGITVTTALYPTIELPKKWKELGKGVEVETVPDILDAEIDEALTSIRRARAKMEMKSSTPEMDSSAGPVVDAAESISASEKLDPAAPMTPVAEENLPALDDAFAQSLGNFTSVADLKEKLRENMKSEKDQQAKEKRRSRIIEELLKMASVDVPSIFVDSELDKIIAQMKDDVTRFGMTFEGYLEQVKKTEADMRADLREQAKNRAKLQLLLNKIAEEEKLENDNEAVEKELAHALEHFPDARPELVRIHIETVLRNEKVLQLLESTN